MPELFARKWTRGELMRRIGRLEQVAGVRHVVLGDGTGRGVRLLEFRTGTGFSFDVLVDRCFDIGRCELGGQPLAWVAPPGVVAPSLVDPHDWEWFRAWGGGMVVTCGLDHFGTPGEDSAEQFHQPHLFKSISYGLHGRVGGLPARLSGYGERWEGEECILWAEGEVQQVSVFGENLLLRRRIEARVGESRFRLHDVVENAGYCRTPHMFLYHCNVGYPVVDDGSEIVVASRLTTTDYETAVEGYRTLSAPIPDITESCFEHELVAEQQGTAPVGIVNRRRGLGVYQVFRLDQLPHHTVWRMMGEGNYAVALEPATNRDAGRNDARKRGELIELAPGQKRIYDLEIGALDGAKAVEAFERRVGAIPVSPPA